MDCKIAFNKSTRSARAQSGPEVPLVDLSRPATGIPQHIAAIAEHLFVPLTTFRIPNASVAWLNRAWFAEHGVATRTNSEQARVESWLLDSFAYVAPRSTTRNHEREDCKVIYPDRYGATGVAAHGGAGRAAACGNYYVKGVGSTSLVGKADWHHSHGMLWLEEGLREAVMSEALRHELPFGAVPVIAVISTMMVERDGDVLKERALLVRPFKLRPSHLQRAVGFWPCRANHLDDIRRVRAVINWLGNQCDIEGQLDKLSRRAIEQAACCRVLKVFHGGFCMSNISIDGELLDFGSARSFRSYEDGAFEVMGQAIGDEILSIKAGLDSLAFYVNRHGTFKKIRVNDSGIGRQYAECVLRITKDIAGPGGVHIAEAAATAILRKVHGVERHSTRSYSADTDLGDGQSELSTPRALARLGWMKAFRESLDRDVLQQHLDACINNASRKKRDLSELVDKAISSSRRWDRVLPGDFIPESIWLDGTCLVVFGKTCTTSVESDRVWINAPVVDETVQLKDRYIVAKYLSAAGAEQFNYRIAGLLDRVVWASMREDAQKTQDGTLA